jgi:hypothetical protein
MSNLRIIFHTDSGTHTFAIDESDADDQRVSVSMGEKATRMMFESLWRRGMRPAGYVDPSKAIVMINGRPAADYMSHSDIPEGFYTVASYLARHNPEALAFCIS